MKAKHHIRHDQTLGLFEAEVAAPVQAQATVRIEFDGGTPCNIPRLVYGIGYGSYRIEALPIVRVDHERPMSANAAEIWTLVRAIEAVAALHNPETTALEIAGDSKIALARCKGASKWKAKSLARSDEFTTTCGELARLCGMFRSVETCWRGRAASVQLFGH